MLLLFEARYPKVKRFRVDDKFLASTWVNELYEGVYMIHNQVLLDSVVLLNPAHHYYNMRFSPDYSLLFRGKAAPIHRLFYILHRHPRYPGFPLWHPL
jgi:hypothetical protein